MDSPKIMQTMDTKRKGIEYKQMEQTLYKKDREKKDYSLRVKWVTDKSGLHCPVRSGTGQSIANRVRYKINEIRKPNGKLDGN